MIQIPLTGKYGQGKFAIIDDEDWDKVKDYKWRLCRIYDNVFVVSAFLSKNKSISLHNLILGIKWVDHKDGDTLDNRRSNLRSCTNSQNQMNKRKPQTNRGRLTSSKYKGVIRLGLRNRYRAQIGINGKQVCLGYFNTEIEAAKVYNGAAEKCFGEFAKLNQL